jgi:hypothetical protein
MPPKAAKKSGTTAKAAKPTKTKRGPSAPSAYIIFCKENRAEVQKENPDATFGEMGKLLGAKWASMSDEEKEVRNSYKYFKFKLNCKYSH